MLAGMLGLCTGVYGLLDGTTPRALGLPALLAGSVLCCAGLALGGRRVRRTSYRPDPWRVPEWIVAGCGVRRRGGAVRQRRATARSELNPSLYPLRWPSLPLVPAAAILLAGVAGARRHRRPVAAAAERRRPPTRMTSDAPTESAA